MANKLTEKLFKNWSKLFEECVNQVQGLFREATKMSKF